MGWGEPPPHASLPAAPFLPVSSKRGSLEGFSKGLKRLEHDWPRRVALRLSVISVPCRLLKTQEAGLTTRVADAAGLGTTL